MNGSDTNLFKDETPPPLPCPRSRRSKLAIASFGLAVLSPLALIFAAIPALGAIILGHMARVKIKKSYGLLRGKGMSLAGLVIGYIVTFISLALAIVVYLSTHTRSKEFAACDLEHLRDIVARALQQEQTVNNMRWLVDWPKRPDPATVIAEGAKYFGYPDHVAHKLAEIMLAWERNPPKIPRATKVSKTKSLHQSGAIVPAKAMPPDLAAARPYGIIDLRESIDAARLQFAQGAIDVVTLSAVQYQNAIRLNELIEENCRGCPVPYVGWTLWEVVKGCWVSCLGRMQIAFLAGMAIDLEMGGIQVYKLASSLSGTSKSVYGSIEHSACIARLANRQAIILDFYFVSRPFSFEGDYIPHYNYLSLSNQRAHGDAHSALQPMRAPGIKAILLNQCGVVLADARDGAEALRAFIGALSLMPDYAGVYHNRGLYYARIRRDMNAAINDFTKAIILRPDCPWVYRDRAVAWYWEGNYTDAWHDVEACRALGGVVDLDFINKLKRKSGTRSR